MALLAVLSAAGCTGTPPGSSGPSATSQASSGAGSTPAADSKAGGVFILHVAGISSGGTQPAALPAAFSCMVGTPVSPPVSWENVPEGTETLALIVLDPDAPNPPFTHWIVYNIPKDRTGIPEGQGSAKELDGGGQQGINSADQRGYYPACPPIGSKHRYFFELYAVDYTIGLPSADRETLTAMLNGHVIGEAIVKTTFSR